MSDTRVQRGSRFRGVAKKGDLWRASYHGESCGDYETEEGAARAVDKAIITARRGRTVVDGDAELNFPGEPVVDDEHVENCCVCADGGELLMCDSCPRALH